ncbi:MAG: pyridoxamine 5'-phosphate oxidase family protein [Hyphomicrobiales bacterium]
MAVSTLTREEILAYAADVARGQLGGTLATMHAEDGTPYVTFVLFHFYEGARILFGSGTNPQHARNIAATPEVSFLIDNREAIRGDWTSFDRVVIEGRAEQVPENDPRYPGFISELREKNRMAAYFTEHGMLYVIEPRRLVLMRGFQPGRHVVDFEVE